MSRPIARLFAAIVAIVAAGISTTLSAETVTVRAGEHQGFTRLVLTIPAGTAWTTEETVQGYRLALDGASLTYDLTEAFTRIRRDRIATLRASSGAALDIEVACRCRLETYLHRDDMLVVDVIDGADPGRTGFRQSEPERAPDRDVSAVVLPLFTIDAQPSALLAPPGGFVAPEPRSAAFAATERAILESFARAASQGVFAFPSSPVAVGDDVATLPRRIGLTPVTDPMDGVAIPLSVTGGPRPGLLVRTGIIRGEDEAAPPDVGPDACKWLGRLDTAGWVDADAGFFDQMGAGRLALTSETGRVVPDAVVEQARRYVAFGFGREAIDVLGLFRGEVPSDWRLEVRTIATLAELVDGATAPESAVARGLGCGPDAAVWASLARGTLDGTDDAHRDAVLVGLRRLPESLRGHLGLRLAALYSQAGEYLVASEILSASRGEPTGGGRAADLTQADLAGAEYGPEAEIVRLDALAVRDPYLAPETLVRLLDLTAETGQTTTASVLDLAEAVRHEVGGESVERDLVRAEARALFGRDDFAGALVLLDETVDLLGDEVSASLINDTLAALTERAGDDAFLGVILTRAPEESSPKVQNGVAARLIALGLPDLAEPFLRSGAEQAAMGERRYLRAEAAAALGDVAGADRFLEGMTDPRAQAIRARVRTLAGDFPGAYLASDLTEAAPDGDATAWRAGDWTGLETSDDALLSDASRAILSPPSPGTGTPLADRAALLVEAESTRALTEALLQRFTVEPDDGN